MPRTCQVAVFDSANQPLQLRNIGIPTLGPDEVLVRIDACTVCGSDLHTISGARQEKTPTILGHEIVGTIAEIGADGVVDTSGNALAPGDRVTWSICLSCHRCDRCHRGLPQKCRELKKVGHELLTGDQGLLGGFAESIVLPRSASLFRLESEPADEIMCPANCATATTISAFRRITQIKDRSLLVMGAGLLGLTAVAIAAVRGARHITVVDPDERRTRLASEFTAHQTFASLDALASQAPNTLFDIIMDFSGASPAIEQALPLAAMAAEIVLVGSVLPSPACRLDPEWVVRNLIRLHGVHNYTPADLQEAIQFLQQQGNKFPFAGLVEKSFPLEKINEAIAYAQKHRPIRIMIRP